jgi:hypothetical protein
MYGVITKVLRTDPGGVIPPTEASEGLYERIVRLSGGLSEGFPGCLELHRIEPAATVILCPSLRLHLFLVQAAATQPRSPVGRVAQVLTRPVGARAVKIKELRAGEILAAS